MTSTFRSSNCIVLSNIQVSLLQSSFCGIAWSVCGTGSKGVLCDPPFVEVVETAVVGGSSQVEFRILFAPNAVPFLQGPYLTISSEGKIQVVTVAFATTPSQTVPLSVNAIRTFSVRFMLLTKTIAHELSGFFAARTLNWFGVRWFPSLPLRTL